MRISFENDNNIILYAFEKVISFCRECHLLFAARCVWWLVLIIGLYQGLIIHINNKHICAEREMTSYPKEIITEESTTSEPDQQDTILKICEAFLQGSRVDRKQIEYLNTEQTCKLHWKKTDQKFYKSHIEGICKKEIQCRTLAQECQHCTWPYRRQGGHKPKACRQLLRIEKATVPL